MADHNDALANDVAGVVSDLQTERTARGRLEQALSEQALLHQQQTQETMRQVGDLQAVVERLSQPATTICRDCGEHVTDAGRPDHERVHDLEKQLRETNERFPQNAITDIKEKHTHLVRRLPIPNTLVISSGIITRGQDYHLLEPESGTSDNLDKIRNGYHGAMLALRPADSGDTITVRHNQSAGVGDNILLNGDASIVLDDVDDMLVLLYDKDLDTKGAWIEWNGSGGAGLHHTKYTDQNAIDAIEGEATLALSGIIAAIEGDANFQLDMSGSTVSRIRFDVANNDQLEYARATNTWSFKVGNLSVFSIDDSGLVIMGRPDAVRGHLQLRGEGTSSTIGAILELQMAADHDVTDEGWRVRVVEDDLEFALISSGIAFELRADKSAQLAAPLFIKEQSAANTDEASYGQLWIQDDAPNELWFTDDAGSDFLVGSISVTKYVQLAVVGFTTNCATGNDQAFFHVPAGMAGMDLVEVHAEVITAGTGSGPMPIQLRNATNSNVDMLSTRLTIDAGETGSDEAATAAVINASNDNIAENDLISVDIDSPLHTTPAKGLIVTMGFRMPVS